jgi:hypothetical protein
MTGHQVGNFDVSAWPVDNGGFREVPDEVVGELAQTNRTTPTSPEAGQPTDPLDGLLEAQQAALRDLANKPADQIPDLAAALVVQAFRFGKQVGQHQAKAEAKAEAKVKHLKEKQL